MNKQKLTATVLAGLMLSANFLPMAEAKTTALQQALYWAMIDRINGQSHYQVNQTSYYDFFMFMGKDGKLYRTMSDASRLGGGVVRFEDIEGDIYTSTVPQEQQYTKKNTVVNWEPLEQKDVKKWDWDEKNSSIEPKKDGVSTKKAVDFKSFTVNPERPSITDSGKIEGKAILSARATNNLLKVEAVMEHKTIDITEQVKAGQPFTMWEEGESFFQNGVNIRQIQGQHPIRFKFTIQNGKDQVKTAWANLSYTLYDMTMVLSSGEKDTYHNIGNEVKNLLPDDYDTTAEEKSYAFSGDVTATYWDRDAGVCRMEMTGVDRETGELLANVPVDGYGIETAHECGIIEGQTVDFDDLKIQYDSDGTPHLFNDGTMSVADNPDLVYSESDRAFEKAMNEQLEYVVLTNEQGDQVQMAYNPRTGKTVSMRNQEMTAEDKERFSTVLGVDVDSLIWTADENGMWKATNEAGTVTTDRAYKVGNDKTKQVFKNTKTNSVNAEYSDIGLWGRHMVDVMQDGVFEAAGEDAYRKIYATKTDEEQESLVKQWYEVIKGTSERCLNVVKKAISKTFEDDIF